MNSLRARQLVSSFAIIMGSIFILGLILSMFISNRELENERADMKDLGFDILGFFSFDRGDFTIDHNLHDKLENLFTLKGFNDPVQNTVAYIQDVNTKIIHWHSIDPYTNLRSSSYSNISQSETLYTYPISAKPGEDIIKTLKPENPDALLDSNENIKHIVYAYGFQHSPYGRYQLVIAKSADGLFVGDREMLTHLIILFSASALLVLLAQLATSYWVISPIKDFEEEIKRLESGDQETIANPYPEELVPIKSTINALVQYEVGQKRRYRDALDDLAHSLKTPLSAIQGFIEQAEKNPERHLAIEGVSTQLDRMKDIVSYQLKRAVVTNHHAMITPVPLKPVLVRLKESLLKVYHDKNFDIVIKVDSEIKVRMDEDDLLELFGNLLNNACRFCENLVEVNAQYDENSLIINIDDDGMGFPDKNPSKLLQRGIRADSQTEGQGIGLAVCTEIIEAAGGNIDLLVSPQVGARVRIQLPT